MPEIICTFCESPISQAEIRKGYAARQITGWRTYRHHRAGKVQLQEYMRGIAHNACVEAAASGRPVGQLEAFPYA